MILPCSFQCSLHLALVNVNRSLMVSSARLEPDAMFSVAIHDKLKPASHLPTAEHLNASTPLSTVSHFYLNQAVPCPPQLLHWNSNKVTHILPCKAWAPGLLQHGVSSQQDPLWLLSRLGKTALPLEDSLPQKLSCFCRASVGPWTDSSLITTAMH